MGGTDSECCVAKPQLNDFLITDPLAQPGVVSSLPEGVEICDLDDVPYRAEPQVHCVFCKHKRLHNDGYFAILSNGTRAPCGNCCAAKIDAVKKQTIDRSRLRLKRERVERENLRTLTEGLDEAQEIGVFVDKVLGAMAKTTFILREALTPEARDDLRARGVQGIDFFDKPSPGVAFSRSVISAIRGRSEVKPAERAFLMERRQLALQELAAGVAYVKACAAFFDADNLAAIEAWSVPHGAPFGVTKFRVRGKTLHPHGPAIWQNVAIPVIVLPPVVLAFSI
jgi:hypothetical protein